MATYDNLSISGTPGPHPSPPFNRSSPSTPAASCKFATVHSPRGHKHGRFLSIRRACRDTICILPSLRQNRRDLTAARALFWAGDSCLKRRWVSAIRPDAVRALRMAHTFDAIPRWGVDPFEQGATSRMNDCYVCQNQCSIILSGRRGM